MRLDVLIESHHAGDVDILGPDKAVFAYAESYLALSEPTPLSVRFPLRAEPYDSPQVAYWMQNLLPDDREVLQQWCDRYGASLLRPIELLGTVLGAECAGAVQFCDPERTAELLGDRGGRQRLSEEELWRGLELLRADPSYRFSAAHADTGRSLGGMQPKDALASTADGWAVPWGRQATTHILKLDRDLYPHETLVEHVTMRTATRLGMAAPATRMLHGENFGVIVVERYDRSVVDETDEPQRIHQEDLCQALGLPPGRKYQRFHGATVERCADVLRDGGSAGSAPDIRRLRDMLLFRWIVGDTDGHAKNFSLLLSGGQRVLAPLYDSATFLPHRRTREEGDLSFAMWAGRAGQQWRLRETDTARSLAQLAKALGLSAADVGTRAEHLAAGLPSALADVVNGLTAHEQDTLDNLDLVRQVVTRSSRCAATAAELRPPG
ncbi:MAG: HipA domain-containing protein [bacterium]|nr:HipA domain-containing protein [bacterium]